LLINPFTLQFFISLLPKGEEEAKGRRRRRRSRRRRRGKGVGLRLVVRLVN
jgi:hypothetical protein